MSGLSFLVSPETQQQAALWANEQQSSFDKERAAQQEQQKLSVSEQIAESRQKAYEQRSSDRYKQATDVEAQRAKASADAIQSRTNEQSRLATVKSTESDNELNMAPGEAQIKAYTAGLLPNATPQYIGDLQQSMAQSRQAVRQWGQNYLQAGPSDKSEPAPDISTLPFNTIYKSSSNPMVQEKLRAQEANWQSMEQTRKERLANVKKSGHFTPQAFSLIERASEAHALEDQTKMAYDQINPASPEYLPDVASNPDEVTLRTRRYNTARQNSLAIGGTVHSMAVQGLLGDTFKQAYLGGQDPLGVGGEPQTTNDNTSDAQPQSNGIALPTW
jgi:hypothetical protein